MVLNEIVKDFHSLVQDQYGNYVIQVGRLRCESIRLRINQQLAMLFPKLSESKQALRDLVKQASRHDKKTFSKLKRVENSVASRRDAFGQLKEEILVRVSCQSMIA